MRNIFASSNITSVTALVLSIAALGLSIFNSHNTAQRVESSSTIEGPDITTYMTPQASERFLAALCKAEVFPADALSACAERNPQLVCSLIGPHSAACKPICYPKPASADTANLVERFGFAAMGIRPCDE